MADQLQAQPLSATGQFNWVFLIELLVSGILGLFFLFYFNRLFATIISYIIRVYTWRYYKAHIEIASLQISLLGGRLFFKNIRYHAHNITLNVYEGHVTWRYWLRAVQEAEIFQDEGASGTGKPHSASVSSRDGHDKDDEDEKSRARSRSIGREEQAGIKPKKELPCRIAVKVAGVEAFIYNRSPFYDNIVEATTAKARKDAPEDGREQKGDKSQTSFSESSKEESEGSSGVATRRTNTHTTNASSKPVPRPEVPAFLCIFPIKVECKRAAAAIGNQHTTHVVVAKAERAGGVVDAGRAGHLDLWKLLFKFSGEQVSVSLKPNRDFKEPQLESAQKIVREKQLGEPSQPEPVIKKGAHKAQSIWSSLCYLFRRNRSTNQSIRASSLKRDSLSPQIGAAPLDQVPGKGQWHGLRRYLDENERNEHEEWSGVEYAKVSQLVDVEKVTMRFYWDMPGPMPNGSLDSDTLLSSTYENDINGCMPPEYGMDIGVHEGVVTYGPWADRQRINIQQVFFPAPFVDGRPAQSLQPGDLRVSTVMKITVTVEEEVVVRIPAREESKDSKWKGRAEMGQGPESAIGKGGKASQKQRKSHRRRRKGQQGPAAVDARPFAWLDIVISKDTVVNYTMDIFPRANGYNNSLDVDVRSLEMNSSVNHGLLWRSGPVSVRADISQPITWNTLRDWPFKLIINDMELFILRDHLFLIIDLVNDWGSGAVAEFYTFVPYNYQLDLTFNNFVMYLNVNDANIISDPADFDKNDFLTLEGQMHAILGIPMKNYRPKTNRITFDVLATEMSMRMLSPSKSTFNAFLEEKTMATLPELTLNGSYTANQDAKIGNVDALRMDLVGTGLNLKAFGFFVRQLVNVKENYFGDYMHFKTLEEFQSASDDFQEANAKTASFPKPTSINELDVILCVVAEQATVLLPTTLYSCKEFVRIDLPRADLDLRIVSYYLDMGLQLSPISFLTGQKLVDQDNGKLPTETESSTQLWCSHVDLSGHRAFGLPPNEDAYVSQWNIDVGKLGGELSSKFVRDLVLGAQAMLFMVDDAENALPVLSPAVALDASFVQVRTNTVRLWMHVGNDAVLLDLAPIEVDVSGWASHTFSQRVSVLAPLVTLACVDARSASRHRTLEKRKEPVRTYAFLQTGAAIDVVGRKAHFQLETKKQQAHFKLHDQRTNRYPFLIRPEIDAAIRPEDELPFEPPASPFPLMPSPLTFSADHQYKSAGSAHSVRSARSLLSKSSFGSLAGSIRGRRNGEDIEQAPLRESARAASERYARRRGSGSSSAATSFGRPSALLGDHERAKFGLPSSTMAFGSPYSEPYFPLEMIAPDETNVPSFAETSIDDTDPAANASFDPAAIDGSRPDTDVERTSVLIRIAPGIRAYIEPHVAITAAQLVDNIVPRTYEEVMDSFQVSVMGVISAYQVAKSSAKSILEVQATLPSGHLRVALLDVQEDATVDQLDMNLRHLQVATRIRSIPSGRGPKQELSLHTLLNSLKLTIAPVDRGVLPKPTVTLQMTDILMWLAFAETQGFHVSLRDTHLAVAGPQARYLSLLALKMIPVVKDIENRFRDVLTARNARLHYLTYVLTHNGHDVGDPPFMARLLFILRAFPGHFRNTDSWKIVSRFRHILNNLPAGELDKLKTLGRLSMADCPEDAPKMVLNSWNQWRNWDVPYVNQTTAFQILFGGEERAKLEPYERQPLTLTFRSELFRIVLEGNEKNSDLVIEDVSLGVENTPPTKPEGLMLVDENKRTSTVLQAHARTIAFSLNWELFSIAEDVLQLKDQIEEAEIKLKGHGKRTAQQALEDSLARHDIHAVISTDTGVLSLQSINARHLSRIDGMKLAVIGTTQASEQYGQCASLLLNVDTAITECHGPTSRIWQTLLSSPSIYVDHVQASPGVEIPPTITLAMAYEDLRVSVEEQVPGILHIVDTIIADEVTKIQSLVQKAKQTLVQPMPTPSLSKSELSVTQTATVSATRTTTSTLAPKFHLALLAGNIHVEVSLLQALYYQLDGVAAGIRAAPSLTKEKTFGINFDVGRMNHAFVNTSNNDRHVQGLLDVPPINGYVGLEMGRTETIVSVSTTIEKVEVDAGAIQGMVGVLGQEEVQHVISAIKTGVQDIQDRVAAVFPEEHKPKSKPIESQRISFDARLALLGVRVSTTTPTGQGRGREITAELEFGFGPLHATASNRTSSQDLNPLIPEIRAYVQDIGASLQIRDRGKTRPCGNLTFGIALHFNNFVAGDGSLRRELKVRSNALSVNGFPDTASTIVDVINHLQDRIKHLDLSKELEYLRKLRNHRRQTVIQKIGGKKDWAEQEELAFSPEDLLSIATTIELNDIQAAWLVDRKYAPSQSARVEDLVFSISSVKFDSRGSNEARLTIHDMQLQLAKVETSKQRRGLNSALLPEIGFSVAYWNQDKTWSFAFRATGKPLDLRLESKFMLPVAAAQRSIEAAMEKFKRGTATWKGTPTTTGAQRKMTFDTKRIQSVLVEADFAGARVHMQGSAGRSDSLASIAAASQQQGAKHGRYGQFAAEGAVMQTTLTAPGFAFKVEYNSRQPQPTINGELMVDASSNMLAPNVVPLVLEVSNSIKAVMQRDETAKTAQSDNTPSPMGRKPSQKEQDYGDIVTTTPAKFFGRTKVDLGLRVAKQEFGLSCQPIAKVDAKASLEDFYITMNTIDSDEHGHFFAMSIVLTRLQAQVKHMYSREPTFSYDMDSIVVSVMNNKHLSGTAGISAVLNINPTKIVINGKQFQDLLLFREIWLPPEIRSPGRTVPRSTAASRAHPADQFVVQKYQNIAAAAAFPWNATVNISHLTVDLDLGQSIGKTSFTIANLWANQQKSSDWEQNLCLGLDEMAANSTGRMSGLIQLEKLGVRTSITWPEQSSSLTGRQTPLVQASAGFNNLRAKAAFDYQAFAFADIQNFDFLMYNVRDSGGGADRLVAVVDCGKAYVFCTSTSPAQAVGLYQAFDRLIQEKQSAYTQSLKDIEKHIRKESTVVPTRFGPTIPDSPVVEKQQKTMISLHTDVVVTVGAVCFGVYPGTFFDSQMLKLEANNIQARFAVGLERGQITSGLGMTLGQLQVALSSTRRVTAVPKALEITVDEVVNNALNARAGIILRVPKVVASMQTWQGPKGNEVEYIFKSLFDGKIDVGWNLSRINFIKGMWTTHSRALASRLGKSLPESAVKISASGGEDSAPTDIEHSEPAGGVAGQQQEKITAEINLPQSKYEYRALEPPVIETPQLRDMGEATPPLEWIGLHRERLPNVVHQIIIVSLLEVCREVEDAYTKILGSSGGGGVAGAGASR